MIKADGLFRELESVERELPEILTPTPESIDAAFERISTGDFSIGERRCVTKRARCSIWGRPRSHLRLYARSPARESRAPVRVRMGREQICPDETYGATCSLPRSQSTANGGLARVDDPLRGFQSDEYSLPAFGMRPVVRPDQCTASHVPDTRRDVG
jgi:hypothetical protein